MTATCKTCPHFSMDGLYKSLGYCRINPPVASRSPHMHEYGVWPLVAEADWCSKHPERFVHSEWRGGAPDEDQTP